MTLIEVINNEGHVDIYMLSMILEYEIAKQELIPDINIYAWS